MADEDLSKLRIQKGFTSTGGKGKRPLIIAVLLILFAVAPTLYFSGILKQAVRVRVYNVQKVYPSQTFTLLNASGYVVAQRKAALATKITGRLVYLGVEEGSSVKKDQVVARLENDDAVAARDRRKADLELARARSKELRVELKNAGQELGRKKSVVGRGYVSELEYEAAVARYEKAEAVITEQEAAIGVAEAALREAQVNVDYALIKSPFDAVVLTKNADMGDIVTPLGAAANAKAAVVTIADMNSLQVEADVSESNIELVQVGKPCIIQLDALPQDRFEGKVHMIVPTADRSKASVMVKVSFERKDPRILPEMSARVGFLSRPQGADEARPVLAVAVSAIASRDGREILYVVKDGRVRETIVRTGRRLGDWVEVLEGIEAGDKVALSPDGLTNDSRAQITED